MEENGVHSTNLIHSRALGIICLNTLSQICLTYPELIYLSYRRSVILAEHYTAIKATQDLFSFSFVLAQLAISSL